MDELLATADTVLNVTLIEFAGTAVTPVTILTFVLVLAIAYWVSELLQRAGERALRARGVRDEGTIGSGRRVFHYFFMGAALVVALDMIGIEVAALFAAGAVFAVAIGFAMQNITQNFVSGIILLFERSIQPGDVLKVEDTVVRVQKLGVRSTVARSRDEEELIVPNSVLAGSTVINYTLADSLYRVRAAVGVDYDADMAFVRETLETMAEGLEWRNETEDPRIFMLEFGGSTVNFEVSVWVDDPWRARRALSRLNRAIWWALKDADITIAFPQVDVHLDAPVEESLGGLQRIK